ncbi:MAG TPA: hypothetical protein VNO82_16040 [Solirubrobacteraceae bacterium]|nr:hypothetical protein [Solirubrobacteraceae bacterium]
MRPAATTRTEFFADSRFSEEALITLRDALRARATSHPDNPGLVACLPAVPAHRMAGACAELIRLGYPVTRVTVGGWNGAKARDGWTLGA